MESNQIAFELDFFLNLVRHELEAVDLGFCNIFYNLLHLGLVISTTYNDYT